ncbi:hypothetical protein VM1G_07150 [Cytospora mali]|uniref:Glutamyl-tRNA synthetase n=1 Tax=Cytospora mali TaxID=578113 RepID=A0A194W5K1_CYTMA|nr:hypothetical protein VM1G_07150 [Valsa mali]
MPHDVHIGKLHPAKSYSLIMAFLTPLEGHYASALKLIDEAHAQDPNKIPSADGSADEVPYELHYAHKMTRWLAPRCPDASPALQIACRAQHFRRWELPRSSYPMTRAGYLTWRTKQKAQAAAQVKEMLGSMEGPLPADDLDRISALISKQDLATNEETQVLEDVACLVFLDDQFDDFEKKPEYDDDKIISILQKTWGKMSPKGREMALQMKHSDRALSLLGRALQGA